MSSQLAGELRCYLNLMTLDSLPQSSTGPSRRPFRESAEAIRAAGFDGVQFGGRPTRAELDQCRSLGLEFAGSGRVNRPGEASELAEQFADDGCECATLHVGWGLEDDEDAGRLIESILKACDRWRIPLYVETHRATIFQDMWRTVGFLRRFPELKVNGDFSHWYTGQEMVYGGFEMKLAFLAPALDRVRFLHGRIGDPGCIQVALKPNAVEQPVYVEHFKQLWTACFKSFCRVAQPGDRIYFAPELLGPEIYYARTCPNSKRVAVEESDRWEQSLILKQMARDSFQAAVCPS